jgi:hypothetical protein
VRSARGLLVALVLVSCTLTAPPDTNGASAPPVPVTVSSRTPGEIADLLARYNAAVRAKDLAAFQRTIDGTRLAFRRCEAQFFDIAARLGYQGLLPGRVAAVEPYHGTYVRAWVGDEGLGYERLYFRLNDARAWVLTEPTLDDLGGERTRTFDGLAVEYWGADEDVIDVYVASALRARDAAAAIAPRPTKTPWSLRILPTRETIGVTAACGTGADSSGFTYAIRVFPGAIFVDRSRDRVVPATDALFMHEALHQVQYSFIPKITVRLDWWLVEGWPDYTAQSRSQREIRSNICAPTVPTFKQLVDGPRIEADTPPEVRFQYYSYANTMVGYLYETFGENAYWDLVSLYPDNVEPKNNYPKALGVTPEAFYSGWLAWAKRKYC